MSTRKYVHQTVLSQRILIRRQTSPVKCSRKSEHQPRIWAPNSLHFAHMLYFAHQRSGQCLLLRFDCRSEGFAQGASRSGPMPAHETSALLTSLLHLVLPSTFRLSKEMHTISSVFLKSQFIRIVHRRR